MCTMESEQFFLKWNNFENNLTSGFADLLEQEAMVDVTLAAEGRIVQAHKIILSICSSYFRNMFEVNPCQHPIVVLKDVGYQELTDMLDFMYKGEANVRQQDLPSFLKLAETLKVKGLAGSQAEPDEESKKKNYQSQVPTLTKDSLSNETEVPSNDYLQKDAIMRKKRKSSISSSASPESKFLPPSGKIKMEMDYDSNYVENNVHVNPVHNVIMKEERLSDNSLDSYAVDNHVPHEPVGSEKDAGPSTYEENSEMPQACLPTSDYNFVETSHGGRLLLLNGYTFRKKNAISDRSYWLCNYLPCRAKGIMYSDGQFRLTYSSHNHSPIFEVISRKKCMAQLRKLALQENTPGPELLKRLGITQNTQKFLTFIRTCRNRYKKRQMQKELKPPDPRNVGLNYKMIASRVSSKEMIYHSGYLYREDTHKEGLTYWRCRIKSCKARAKTDEVGNLTILKGFHNHSAEESEGVFRAFKLMLKIEAENSTKSVDEIIKEYNIRSISLKNFIRKIRKKKISQEASSTMKTKEPKAEIEELDFCSATDDNEIFNIEKLMADTLGEDYGVLSNLTL